MNHEDTEVTALEVRQETSLNLFGASDAVAVIERATEVANALTHVINDKHLYKEIRSKKGDTKKHVLVEGWTLLGSMLGVFPHTVWTRKLPLEDFPSGAWEARVEAVTRSGDVVSAAESMCSRDEDKWKTRDDYALRSMAATRATAKALRLALGFVVSLAGFEATPAEELPDDSPGRRAPEQPITPEQAERIRTGFAQYGLDLEDALRRAALPELEQLSAAQAAKWISRLDELDAEQAQAQTVVDIDGDQVDTQTGEILTVENTQTISETDVALAEGAVAPWEDDLPRRGKPPANEQQVEEIIRLCSEMNTDPAGLCRARNVEALDHLSWSQAEAVLKELRQKSGQS